MASLVKKRVINLAKRTGVIRARDLSIQNIPRVYLSRLLEEGSLIKTSRGIYRLANQELNAFVSLSDAALRIPNGVVCLLSALRFHEIGTQAPFQVWIAIDKHARKPTLDNPPLRVLRFSGPALNTGVESHRINGANVKVFSVEKTIADCFKYRNKIGTEVALEALKDAHRTQRIDLNKLWQFAEICRVTKVIRPYLEAITWNG